MDILGGIGIVIGVVTIIFLSVKEVHIAVAAPIAAILVIIFNGMELVPSLMGKESHQFMGALGGYIISFFPLFLLGSILAKYMEESGAVTTIANYILEKIGYENPYRVLVAIFIVSAILTYGGISLFVAMFAIIPLARTLFKKMDLAWNLIQVPLWLGICSITMTVLPGSPAFQNVIPVSYLGTSLIALPIPSLIGALGCTIWGLLYMRHCLHRSLKRNENFSTYTTYEEERRVSHSSPNFISSMIPLVVLIVLAFAGSIFGNQFWRTNIIYVALIVSIVLAVGLFKRYLPSPIRTLSIGSAASIAPLFVTAASVGFGSMVMWSPGFELLIDKILAIPGSPLISLITVTAVMSVITGSSSGTLGIIVPNFAQYYLDTGLNPELIHRVVTISSNVISVLPHSGVVLTFMALTKLNYRNGYKDTYIVISVGCAIALCLVLIFSSIL